jgi:UDP:flavonoid glycosyltransferase YjiC (YdhE family)
VAETGYGVRLDPYRCTSEELHGAIATLLGDPAGLARSAQAGSRIRAADGVQRAADLIEKAAIGTAG